MYLSIRPDSTEVSFPSEAGIVSLAEVKRHLSLQFDGSAVTDGSYDTMLGQIIVAATTFAGDYIGQSLEASTRVDYYKEWARRLILSTSDIDTGADPVITYYDSDHALQSVPVAQFQVDTTGDDAAIIFTTAQTASLSQLYGNPVSVSYDSLHTTAVDNRAIKQAVLIMCGDMFKDRETMVDGSRSKAHLTAERLLAPYRRNWV